MTRQTNDDHSPGAVDRGDFVARAIGDAIATRGKPAFQLLCNDAGEVYQAAAEYKVGKRKASKVEAARITDLSSFVVRAVCTYTVQHLHQHGYLNPCGEAWMLRMLRGEDHK